LFSSVIKSKAEIAKAESRELTTHAAERRAKSGDRRLILKIAKQKAESGNGKNKAETLKTEMLKRRNLFDTNHTN